MSNKNKVKKGELSNTARGGLTEVVVMLHAKWSQEQFGSDENVGPTGALYHLLEEVEEELIPAPDDITEYADAFLLLLDALRRAGYTFDDLLRASMDKIEVNKNREWAGPDENGVSRHIKEEV